MPELTLVTLHGCCKAPKTELEVTGESLAAMNAVVPPGTISKALYYTCILNSRFLAAGAHVPLPKDCFDRQDATRWAQLTGPDVIYVEGTGPGGQPDVDTFADEMRAEICGETEIFQGPDFLEGLDVDHLTMARRGDFLVGKILSIAAGPDVAWYVTYEGLRDTVLEYVQSEASKVETPYVLLGHSLGSLIGYELLTARRLNPPPIAFVTVGSPLRWGPIRSRIHDPLTVEVAKWVNIYDPSDWATKRGPLDHPQIENVRLKNAPVDGEHDLYGYLTDPEARKSIRALLGAIDD